MAIHGRSPETEGANLNETDLKPLKPIRRFDIFAEFSRLEALRDGLPGDEAKGHGLWLAKVVASRKMARTHHEPKPPSEKRRQTPAHGKWHALDGEEQTDRLFDLEIVQRMGPEFYQQVFSPAIQSAFAQGRSYRDIRDTLRADWKP